MEDFADKMEIILRQERDTYIDTNRRYYQRISSKKQGRQTYTSMTLQITRPKDTIETTLQNPNDYELIYENLRLLGALYQTISKNEDKSLFKRNLVLVASNENDLATPLVIEFILKNYGFEEFYLTFINYIGNIIDSRRPMHTFSQRLFFLITLGEILRFEHNLFSDDDLKVLNRYIRNLLSAATVGLSQDKMRIYLQAIDKITQNIMFLRLRNELVEGYNTTINEDKKAVLKKIKDFGFPEELNKALNKIDEYYWDMSKDEFDWSSAIGKIREFWSKLIDHMSKRVEEKTGKTYKEFEGKTKISKQRKFISSQLKLRKEKELIGGFIAITNSKGSHSLISEREYFRLTKNLNIELSLLLLTKLEKFLET